MLPKGPTTEPHALEAENQVLGSILLDPSLIDKLEKSLKPSQFHDDNCRLVYQSMLELNRRGIEITPVAVRTYNKDCTEKIYELVDSTATSSGLEHYISIIEGRALQRNLMSFGQQMAEMAAVTDDPHEMQRVAVEALAKMNGQLSGGDRRIIQSSNLMSALWEKDVKQPAAIVGNGVIREGSFVLLYGRPGMGKTWLAAQLALAVASGKPWLGMPTEQRRVALVEMELTDYYLKERIIQLTATMDPEERQMTLGNIEYLAKPDFKGVIDLMDRSARDGLITWIMEHKIGVLILDAMSRMHFARENDAQEMGQVLANIEYIRDHTGCSIVAIHHEPKESGKEEKVSDLDAARGSSRFQSDPQTMMRLKLFQGRIVLAFPKMNLGPEMGDIYLERDATGGFVVIPPPKDPAVMRSLNAAKVEAALLEAGPSGTTAPALAERLGMTAKPVKRHLDQVGVRVGKKYFHQSFVDVQQTLPQAEEEA